MSDKPIEYYVGRSIDPFTIEFDRRKAAAELCAHIESDFDGPATAMKILSYRMLSPDQAEAVNAIDTLDLCVKKCGTRVIGEIGKYKFLNQFIRLLSPKYQGTETSPEIKNRAIELLFKWKESMKQIEKLQQVYNMLKEQGIIKADPIIEVDIPQVPKPLPRVASFEDEEKSQLLAELLQSKNPEDLQIANRLIKSMVKSDEQKKYRRWEQRNIMETARQSATVLYDVVTKKGTNEIVDVLDPISQSQYFSYSEISLMHEMYSTLLSTRPTLFKYTSEAAETDDPMLGEMLTLLDEVNKAMEKYTDIMAALKKMPPRQGPSPYKKVIETNPSSSKTIDDVDMLSILSRNSTPAIQRRGIQEIQIPEVTDETDTRQQLLIDELTALSVELSTQSVERYAVGDSPQSSNEHDMFLLDHRNISVESLELVPNQTPQIFINEPLVRGTLFKANHPHPRQRNTIYVVVVISSTSPLPLRNVNLKMSSKSILVVSKLIPPSAQQLNGFNPVTFSQNVSQVLLLLPLSNNVTEVDLSYELTFESMTTERFEGCITFKI